jgi:hypothetical protein
VTESGRECKAIDGNQVGLLPVERCVTLLGRMSFPNGRKIDAARSFFKAGFRLPEDSYKAELAAMEMANAAISIV